MHDQEIQAFLDGDYERVVWAVVAVCGDRHRAEDAVQDVLVDVWEKHRTVDDLTAWVTTAAMNRTRSRWRSMAAERRAFLRLGQRSVRRDAHQPAPLDGALVEALRSLPRAQRETVALHYLLDMSVADVAVQLGVTEGTVKTHLHRGRSALRSAMDNTAHDEESTHVRR